MPVPLPPALTPQSRIAVAAPSSAALSPADAQAGLAALRARFASVDEGLALAAPHGYLSAPDATRAQAFNALLTRDDLDGIVCLRGGFGLTRILDRIDYDALTARPKLIVGYSDVTALHLAAWARAGVPGLSGPMAAPDWGPGLDAETEAQFWTMAGGAAPVEILGPGGEPLVPLRAGAAEGTLVGGNLVLLASLVGTPFLPDLTGAILFLEDVGEAPYRLDGLLARLRLAGVLERLGGLVFGLFTGAEPPTDRPSFTADQVLAHYARFVPGPVASGLVYGHVRRKSTLPVGVRARLVVRNDGSDTQPAGSAELWTLEPVAAAGTS